MINNNKEDFASDQAGLHKPLVWTNMDHVLASVDRGQHHGQPAPSQRWGHACVSAYDRKMIIIGGYQGQYLGDIWEFNFADCKYQQHVLRGGGEDVSLLARSNHTAIFYQPHNAIYVFGGGQAQRVRFNDTLKLTLSQEVQESDVSHLRLTVPMTIVSKVQIREGSPMPSARTYHASCLIDKFMIVSGGESNNMDLSDMWALDLDRHQWFKLEYLSRDGLPRNQFMSKRFHTVSALSGHRVVSFGGCHSEYVHLNDLFVFDLSTFVESNGQDVKVVSFKVDFSKSPSRVPTTRWGHAAAVYRDQLFVLGGRNNDDINDLHKFDIASQSWTQVEISHPMPKPRRRHSAVFVSSTLVMFGGFDGEFYNDLHLLDLDLLQPRAHQECTATSLEKDYASLVNSRDYSDIRFVLDPQTPGGLPEVVHANKSLVLYRLFEREIRDYDQNSRVFQLRMEDILSDPQTKTMVSPFFVKVYEAQTNESVRLANIPFRDEFILFLQFCYCEKFVQPVTGLQIERLRFISKQLQLQALAQYFDCMVQHVHNKLQSELIKDYEAKVMQQLGNSAADHPLLQNPISNLTVEQRVELEQSVAELKKTIKFNFNQLASPCAEQSPEDRVERQNHRVHAEMVKCRNLDHFFDVVFTLEGGHKMKANSVVLRARSDYFRIMFDSQYGFAESSYLEEYIGSTRLGRQQLPLRLVQVKGIQKQYFTAIIQFLYCDSFLQTEASLAFYLRVMIYADYFMLHRLSQICQESLCQFLKPQNALELYLVAHAHNASLFEAKCINFLAINERAVERTAQWKSLKKTCATMGSKASMFNKIKQEVEREKQRNFVSISVQQMVQAQSSRIKKPKWPSYYFGAPLVSSSDSQTAQSNQENDTYRVALNNLLNSTSDQNRLDESHAPATERNNYRSEDLHSPAVSQSLQFTPARHKPSHRQQQRERSPRRSLIIDASVQATSLITEQGWCPQAQEQSQSQRQFDTQLASSYIYAQEWDHLAAPSSKLMDCQGQSEQQQQLLFVEDQENVQPNGSNAGSRLI